MVIGEMVQMDPQIDKKKAEHCTYFLQLKARESFARRRLSAAVVFTLPVVGVLSVCIAKMYPRLRMYSRESNNIKT